MRVTESLTYFMDVSFTWGSSVNEGFLEPPETHVTLYLSVDSGRVKLSHHVDGKQSFCEGGLSEELWFNY